MEVEKAARYGNPLSIMFLDLDDFKQFNDAYGHPEGDKVLKKWVRSSRMACGEQIWPSDTVARNSP